MTWYDGLAGLCRRQREGPACRMEISTEYFVLVSGLCARQDMIVSSNGGWFLNVHPSSLLAATRWYTQLRRQEGCTPSQFLKRHTHCTNDRERDRWRISSKLQWLSLCLFHPPPHYGPIQRCSRLSRKAGMHGKYLVIWLAFIGFSTHSKRVPDWLSDGNCARRSSPSGQSFTKGSVDESGQSSDRE
jgi:hypothetical protein